MTPALRMTPAMQWPEAETLQAHEIDRLLIELRDRREACMGELRARQSQACGDRTADAVIDVMEARLQLNALLTYWRQLLARALSLQNWAPLGSEAPCFADMRGDRGYRTARARTPLTPDSLLFVHGPVTLWHCAALAEDMLEPPDHLTRLVRCAFHRELTFEPRVIVWDSALGAPPFAYDAEEVAVSGVFESMRGRQLAFAAVPEPGCVPTRRAGWHPLTLRIIASQPDKSVQPASIRHALTADMYPEAGDIRRGSSALLAKAEAILAAFTQHILVGERVFLLSRVTNLAIDADFAAWLSASPVAEWELDWARQKAIPGRGAFVPGRFRLLPDDRQWQRTMFVCLDSHLDF
ncbi:MAG: hypothetical protein WBD53_07080 [Xanthobacteraceae bacterium]